MEGLLLIGNGGGEQKVPINHINFTGPLKNSQDTPRCFGSLYGTGLELGLVKFPFEL